MKNYPTLPYISLQDRHLAVDLVHIPSMHMDRYGLFRECGTWKFTFVGSVGLCRNYHDAKLRPIGSSGGYVDGGEEGSESVRLR